MYRAVPAHAPTAHPDAIRIVALSAAIALNAAVLVAALRPLAPQLRQLVAPEPRMTLTFEEPVRPAAPPPIQLPTRPQPAAPTPRTPAPTPPVVHAAPTPVSLPAPVPAVAPTDTVAPAMPQTAAVRAAPSAPVDASLAYLEAPPPPYPMVARRAGMEGRVLLRVLVDESGHPLQVDIARSSGHHLLDRAARDQVLRHWRFQPAQVDGHAVRAWAQVPVTFSLQRM